MTLKTREGFVFGKWTIKGVKPLGRGGNGEVWRVISPNNGHGALKLLNVSAKSNSLRKTRFRTEIRSLVDCSDIVGVLPIIDYHMAEAEDDTSWFVTPIATSLETYIKGEFDLHQAVTIAAAVANTLERMHRRGYSHRDVKPANIFLLDGKWLLGDFGLVEPPLKLGITQKGEKLGPAYYIAPEMLNDAQESMGKAADVYSLGKLIFTLASGQKYPPPGTHDVMNNAVCISAYNSDPRSRELDYLVEAATQFHPSDRPPASHIRASLERWLGGSSTHEKIGDLSSAAQRIFQNTVSLKSQNQRIINNQIRYNYEKERIYKEIDKLLGECAVSASEIGIEVSEIKKNKDNYSFNDLYNHKRDYAYPEDFDDYWISSSSFDLSLSSNKAHSIMSIDFGLVFRPNIEDGVKYIDFLSPVIACAGYKIITFSIDPVMIEFAECVRNAAVTKKCVTSISSTIWADSVQFKLGQPSEIDELIAIKSSIAREFPNAVNELLRDFEFGYSNQRSLRTGQNHGSRTIIDNELLESYHINKFDRNSPRYAELPWTRWPIG